MNECLTTPQHKNRCSNGCQTNDIYIASYKNKTKNNKQLLFWMLYFFTFCLNDLYAYQLHLKHIIMARLILLIIFKLLLYNMLNFQLLPTHGQDSDIYIYVCVCAHTHTRTHARTHAHTHTRTHTHTHSLTPSLTYLPKIDNIYWLNVFLILIDRRKGRKSAIHTGHQNQVPKSVSEM